MHYRYTTLVLVIPLSGLIRSHAQGSGQATLNGNDVDALFHSNGLTGLDRQDLTPHFQVPQELDGSGPSPLYSGGFWIAGRDPAGALHLAAQTYDTDGFDLSPGPLTTDGSASITDPTSLAYDRLWSVLKSDVMLHQAYYNCLSDPDCDVSVEFPGGYTAPSSFDEYPAMGNVAQGQALYLAPFNDFNSDGLYDPDDGDAPCLPGDEALFTIFNDKLDPHTASGAEPMGLEVHMTPFSYYTTGPALQQTVFVRYRLINRSSVRYTDCRIGLYEDFDLGCGDDDFIGTDVGRSMVYVYNWDENDQTCVAGIPGYGGAPPAFGLVVLKGPLLDANSADDGVTNVIPNWNGTGFGDGTTDNERCGLTGSMSISRDGPSAMTDPDYREHFDYYLRSAWKDSTPLSYGGTGYTSDASAIRAQFMFPGDSDPVGAGTGGVPQPIWEESTQINPDRRMLASMGPFSLEAGEEDEILVAYVFARSTSRLASVEALRARVDSVRAFAEHTPGLLGPELDCSELVQGVMDRTDARAQLRVFPDPATDRLNVMMNGAGPVQVRVFDATGRVVMHTRTTTTGGRVELDIQGLTAGTYTIAVQDGTSAHYGRFVRQ